jgi:hypothetical protein
MGVRQFCTFRFLASRWLCWLYSRLGLPSNRLLPPFSSLAERGEISHSKDNTQIIAQPDTQVNSPYWLIPRVYGENGVRFALTEPSFILPDPPANDRVPLDLWLTAKQSHHSASRISVTETNPLTDTTVHAIITEVTTVSPDTSEFVV